MRRRPPTRASAPRPRSIGPFGACYLGVGAQGTRWPHARWNRMPSRYARSSIDEPRAALFRHGRGARGGAISKRNSMLFTRLASALAAASLITLPLAATAQDAPATPVTPDAAASAPAPAAVPSPSIPASPHVMPNGNLVSTLQGSGHFTILLKRSPRPALPTRSRRRPTSPCSRRPTRRSRRCPRRSSRNCSPPRTPPCCRKC